MRPMRPAKVPYCEDSGVDTTESRDELANAPINGLAPPPITTVMKAGAMKAVPNSGTMVVVGA